MISPKVIAIIDAYTFLITYMAKIIWSPKPWNHPPRSRFPLVLQPNQVVDSVPEQSKSKAIRSSPAKLTQPCHGPRRPWRGTSPNACPQMTQPAACFARQQLGSTQRAGELAHIQPPVEATFVERMPAVAQLPHLIPRLQILQANHAHGFPAVPSPRRSLNEAREFHHWQPRLDRQGRSNLRCQRGMGFRISEWNRRLRVRAEAEVEEN